MSQAEVQSFLSAFKAMESRWGDETSLEEMRADLEAFCARQARDIGAEIESVSASGVPCEWVCFPGAAQDRVILYFHGGGYVVSSPQSHRDVASFLSRSADARVLNVGYRLAPEHLFPAAVEDAKTAYKWLLDQGISPDRIALSGDSGGGGLALALLIALRNDGMAQPACAALISPWADLACGGQSYIDNAETSVIGTREAGVMMAGLYLGPDGNARDPLASPVYDTLNDLPPVLMVATDGEVFLDDARTVAEKVKAAGGEAELRITPSLFHTWPVYPSSMSEARDVLDELGAFVKAKTG